MNWLALALSLANDAPHLLPNFVKLWHDIATGKGGPDKVEKVLTDVAATATDTVSTVSGLYGVVKAAQ